MLPVAIVGLFTLAQLHSANAASSYSLVENSSGSTFFDNWNFYNGIDTNMTGNVLYQTKDQATQLNLISVNSAGNVIIKVDNTTDGSTDPNFGRPSVMILSQYTVTKGNLVVFDAVHLPFGCSVWPALWTRGPGEWPDSGEIDIIEGVNLQTQNSISLHTLNGCKHPDASASSSIESGKLISTDCFNQTNGNQGCIVQAPENSYGQGFSQNGGGVYAMEWADTGLSVWFFPRSSVPSDLSTNAPDPTAWGLPTAFFPASSCDFDTFFKPQTLILDITVCGAFAIGAFANTCSGNCLDLVQHPENYNTAYYEISSIKMFAASNSPAASSASKSPSGSATGTGTGSGSSPTGTTTSSGTALGFGLSSALACITVIIVGLLGVQ